MLKTAKFSFSADISIEVEQDDLPVRGNAVASSDEAQDKEVEDAILKRLVEGDIWAWASIKVKASAFGLTGVDYLSACSYESEKDFIENSGYFDDMVAVALEDLSKQVADRLEKVEKL